MKKLIFSISAWLMITLSAAAQLTQGPNNPGSAVAVTCAFIPSFVPYTPAVNVMSSNNSYAVAVHGPCYDDNTNCLNSTNFGFTIPAAATITGIIVDIEKRSDFGSNVQDNQLYLIKAGIPIGTNHATLWTSWPWTDTYETYGGCTDLWGTTWTPAEVNAANFGVIFASIDYSCADTIRSFIDHIRMTICYDMVLPVQLTELKAEQRKDEIALTWKTLTETNNDYFLVEHSPDGIHYASMARIVGAGNSNIQHDYSFIDENPYIGLNYYRIVQYDYDGKMEVFGPVTVNYSPEFNTPVKASWLNEQLIIFVSGNEEENIKCTLYNSTGLVISTQIFKLIQGSNTITWDISPIANGMYVLSVAITNGNHFTEKVVRIIK